MDVEQSKKYKAVKKALAGLDVEYVSHRDDGNINMARVNGFSIIWHQYAYCYGEPDTVEVMSPVGDEYDNVDGHVKISKLRKLVEG